MSNKYIISAMGTLGASRTSTPIFNCKEMLTWVKSVNVVSFRTELDDIDSCGMCVDFIPKFGGKALINYIYTNNKSLVKHLEKARKEFLSKVLDT